MTSWRFRSTLRVADAAFTGEKEVPLDAARLAFSFAPCFYLYLKKKENVLT